MASRYRRFYKKRRRLTGRRGRFRRVKRVWRRLANTFVRSQNYIGSESGAWSSNGYIIRYHDGIQQGDGVFQRTGDVISSVPGGYLKMWIRMNPAWLTATNASPSNVYSFRVITFKYMSRDMGVFPPTGNALFDQYWVTPSQRYKVMSSRNPNNTGDIKVLSDKVYSLSLHGRQHVRVFRKHNWKGKIMWDYNNNNPKSGFYYTIFVTDLPVQGDNAPMLIDLNWKVTWMNVS